MLDSDSDRESGSDYYYFPLYFDFSLGRFWAGLYKRRDGWDESSILCIFLCLAAHISSFFCLWGGGAFDIRFLFIPLLIINFFTTFTTFFFLSFVMISITILSSIQIFFFLNPLLFWRLEMALYCTIRGFLGRLYLL